ncbi:MAG: DUF2177 family protein [Pseudomonadota bacterium]
MLHNFIAWLAVIFAFLVIDAIWLGYLARDFYQRHLGALIREDILFGVAGLFYVLYTVSVVVFVVIPAQKSGSLAQAILLGAFLGLVAYGTYDLTNLATLKGWSVTASVVDMAWGTFLTATISSVGYLVLNWMKST